MWNAFWMTRYIYETTKVAQFRIRAHDQGLRYNKTSNKNVHLLLQHCFKSSQPRCALTTHESNCLATNQVVAGCGKKERRELLFFLQQNLYMLRVLLAQTILFFSNWRKSREWRVSPVILSNPKSVFTQLATTWFGARQVWTWLVTQETLLLNSFCSNVAQQVARFGCPFYRSYRFTSFKSMTFDTMVVYPHPELYEHVMLQAFPLYYARWHMTNILSLSSSLTS